MLKQLTKISAVSLGNIFNTSLGFVWLTAVARELQVDDFGKYALLTSLLLLISRITDFGTNSLYVAKSISEGEHPNSTKSSFTKDLFLTSKVFLFALTIPIAFLTLSFLGIYNPLLTVIFIFGLIFYMFNYTFFAFFQKVEMFHFAVGLNTVPALIKGTFALAVFLNFLNINLVFAFLVFAFSTLSGLILYIKLPKDFKGFSFSPAGLSGFLKGAAPAGLSITITNGWSAIANSVAKLSKGFTDVGIFSVADRFANAFTLISTSIFTVLLPKNARLKKNQLTYDFRETAVLSFGLLFLAFIAIFIAQEMILLVFGDKFLDSIPLLRIVIFASAFTAIHTFVDNFYFVEEKTNIILAITSTKLLVFLISSVVLVPVYGLIGLAFAQLISAVFAVILTSVFMLKLRRV